MISLLFTGRYHKTHPYNYILASKTTHVVLCVTHVSGYCSVPFCILYHVLVISVRMGMCLL